ncbi:MAG: HEAT repeat domain-containing protein [Thermodesulfobacteriota bacterium]
MRDCSVITAMPSPMVQKSLKAASMKSKRLSSYQMDGKAGVKEETGNSLHRRPPLYENQYDEDIMTSAEDAPGSIGSEIDLDPLREALQDENTGVRLGAAEALGTVGGDKAIQALEEAITDNDEAVRMLATIGLRRLKGER